jgi:hypothetical protein
MDVNETFRYLCKENGNRIKVHILNGAIDEMWFSNALEKEWIVIGFQDIKNAIDESLMSRP